MNSMNKTFTPELTPEVMDRLRDYARLFQDDFTHESQRSWSGVYLRGLIQDGERKSIEPMVGRVPLPAQLRAFAIPNRPCSNSSTRVLGTNSRFSTATAP